MAYFKLAPRMGKIRRQCTPMTGEFALITPPNSSVGSESQRVRSGELTLCGESLNSVSFRSRDGRGIADSALAFPSGSSSSKCKGWADNWVGNLGMCRSSYDAFPESAPTTPPKNIKNFNSISGSMCFTRSREFENHLTWLPRNNQKQVLLQTLGTSNQFKMFSFLSNT